MRRRKRNKIEMDGLNITVLGGGSWGVTLTRLLDEKGHKVNLWELYPEVVEELINRREHSKVLPGIKVPEHIHITGDEKEAVKGVTHIVLCVPSHGVRETLNKIEQYVGNGTVIINGAKGIEIETLMRMSEVIRNIFGDRVRVGTLSGPSHAEEVSKRMPTTVVSASEDMDTAVEIQKIFMLDYFRVYTNTDIIGVELGGALKNIIAIAAGGIDGMGFGDNTKGALLTRGLAEMTRLGVAMGAKPLTFAGLSGLGDLITTCMSRHSRNRYVGEMLGRGMRLDDILATMTMVAEGVKTTMSAYKLSQKYGIEMPVTEQVYKALYEDKPARKVIYDLMTRSAKSEVEHDI
ncbi:MAG: NAD(P)H-dependent glycerol-3-phosphate dehydrogenase [bacterium]